MTTGAEIGWFGKLPCAGDFVHRRLPRDLVDALDLWLRQGLVQMRTAYPAQWEEIYRTAPTWNCAIPATVARSGMTLIGLIAPSHDRVGRSFPICAGIALNHGISPAVLLKEAHEWLATLARVVLHARTRPTTIDAFDIALRSIPLPALVDSETYSAGNDILAILNPDDDDVVTVPLPLAKTLPWPDLPAQFDAAGSTSYWWTSTVGGGPLRGFTTDSGLAPTLLVTLMRPPFASALRA